MNRRALAALILLPALRSALGLERSPPEELPDPLMPLPAKPLEKPKRTEQ